MSPLRPLRFFETRKSGIISFSWIFDNFERSWSRLINLPSAYASADWVLKSSLIGKVVVQSIMWKIAYFARIMGGQNFHKVNINKFQISIFLPFQTIWVRKYRIFSTETGNFERNVLSCAVLGCHSQRTCLTVL